MDQRCCAEHGSVESESSGLSCMKCGAPCCRHCARVLASAAYCARCAQSILAAVDGAQPAAVLLRRADTDGAVAPALRPLQPGAMSDPIQWIVLVARDQPDLHAHLSRAFSRDHKVEIVMDRRRDQRRNPGWLEQRLRIHGAAVVRRPRAAEKGPSASLAPSAGRST